jgi:hypothetical protein
MDVRKGFPTINQPRAAMRTSLFERSSMKRNKVPVDRDGDVKNRNRSVRWGVLIGTILLVVGLPAILGWSLGANLTHDWSRSYGLPSLFGFFGFVGGANLMQRISPSFWVVVPQNSAFVTTAMLGRKQDDPNVPYGPGGFPALPWEMRDESGNITLDIFTLPFQEVVPTVDAAMVVDGLVQFKFSLSHINKAIGIDESTITGFVGQINEYLSDTLGPKTSADAKKDVRKLRDQMEEEFETNRKADLEDEYGLMVTGFQITSIDYPKGVQDVKDAIAQAAEINAGVLKILGCTQEELNAHLKDRTFTAQDVRKAREEFLSLSGKMKVETQRVDFTGLENAKGGAAIAAGMYGGKNK